MPSPATPSHRRPQNGTGSKPLHRPRAATAADSKDVISRAARSFRPETPPPFAPVRLSNCLFFPSLPPASLALRTAAPQKGWHLSQTRRDRVRRVAIFVDRRLRPDTLFPVAGDKPLPG